MFTEKISLWLDDELDDSEADELQAHLATCQACRHTYRAMQQVHLLLDAAAATMVTPAPGFAQRFEARLAHRRPVKPWQIVLALSALLLGTLLFAGAWTVMSGLTLVSAGSALLDVDLFYQGVIGFIDSADQLRFFVNLGALFLKASFITMQQPLFWGCLLVAVLMTGLWARALQMLYRRETVTAEFVF
jgi:predicted anti-sigma-YlaC factor YlaD